MMNKALSIITFIVNLDKLYHLEVNVRKETGTGMYSRVFGGCFFQLMDECGYYIDG